MGLMLCITGRSAVGKSTISQKLADETGLPWFGFGSHQRELLGKNPGDISIVRQRYLELWPHHLARIRLDVSEKGMILEGVYHTSFLDGLVRSFLEHDVRLIALRASKSDRLLFYNSRNDRVEEERIKSLKDLDEVKKEIGLIGVLRLADRVYTNVYGDMESCLGNIMRDISDMNGNK